MENKSLDPAGHLSLNVSNFETSKKFYQEIFRLLSYKKIRDTESSAGWVTKEGFGIWLRRAKSPDLQHEHLTPAIHHLCMKAKTKEVVDQVYRQVVAKQVFIFAKPKSYPEFTANYYAVSFTDLDGIKIEVAYY